MKQRVVACLLGSLLGAAVSAQAQGAFELLSKPRVVFLGDSITYSDRYIVYLEAAVRSRYPGWQGELINRGIPSETVAGTSEPAHQPARPNVLERFAPIPALKPDIVVACYGMNDGMYAPLTDAVFTSYKDGIALLFDMVTTQTRAEFVLLTPPPFDPTRLQLRGTPPYDWRNPFPNYNQTLQQFGSWLLSLQLQRTRVIDIHTPLLQHGNLRRQLTPTFAIADDGIHPNPTGHWLIAQSLLQVWRFPAVASEARVDARGRRALTQNVRNIQIARDGAITFDWMAPLPLPVDPEVDPASLVIAQSHEVLGRQTLQVTGLTTNEYSLSVDGKKVIGFLGTQFGQGIPLHHVPEWPLHETSRELLRLVSQRRLMAQQQWVAAETHPRLQDLKPRSVATAAQLNSTTTQIRALAQPKPLKIELRPIVQRVPGDTNLPPSGVTNSYLANPVAPAPRVVPTR